MAQTATKLGAEKVQQYKIEATGGIKDLIEAAKGVLFADYRGLTVEQITQLRVRLGEQASVFRVVRNNYARRAFGDLGVESTGECFVGPTAFALVQKDSGPAAKVLFEYAKTTTLQIKGGYVDGRMMDAGQVEALSRLPGRDELVAKLMGTMKAPVSNLVYVLNGVMQKLLRTLTAVGEQKERDA